MDSQPSRPGHREDAAAAHRGSALRPGTRFEAHHRVNDPEVMDEEPGPLPRTQFIADHGKSALTRNDSPDIRFTWSLNPYRGCEHGCAYCYARPTHEFLGYNAGIDFESRIIYKPDAPKFLRAELSRDSWVPDVIAMSGVTDPYQPVEGRFRLTRQCLEVLAEFRNPVGLVTKNALITRDIDVLQELARHQATVVFLSLTTLDSGLRSRLEPRTSPPGARLAAIRALSDAGIPVGVLVAPIIPSVNDHEVPHLLEAAAGAGARFAGRVMLRLPLAVAPVFENWLEFNLPDRKEKVLNQIRSMRGGKLNSAEFGKRMKGEGWVAEQSEALFRVHSRKYGLDQPPPGLSTAAFRKSLPGQAEFW